ncbi:methyltransferase domain-containing protein [Candidatus Woesearchaeota archaeon]|jgi:tRNA (adenine57-N1/adenine58-N1)-methyltransferase catalytic subunit|nr:methyltransferase domain-containing protein [Candidatus Woesearchaeota archaeon]MBT6520234.1 methyltransferase domain-containing protein [Candidatus Woesearchaeota archaeon]MBT7367245.1 methyltransferase domain-containing protein [Candidatus Woesearchaeota archaeon]
MPKILIRKGKKQYFEDIDREVTLAKQRTFYISDLSKDFSTDQGIIKKTDLEKKDGSVIKTNKDKEFNIFTANFIDEYRRIKRLPQIIPLKDIGFIISQTGIGKDSIIVDGGTGSGALSIFLARFAKTVTTYEINKEHIAIVQENIKDLKIKNLKLKNKSLYDGIDEKNVDLVTLDIPEPWLVVSHAEKALKPGGFLVSYSPTITQTADFVNALPEHKNLVHIKTIELMEREWQVEGRKVRPKSKQIIHSGFLSFVRRI